MVYVIHEPSSRTILVLLEGSQQTCMTYTIAECTVNKLMMMDKETCSVKSQNKFVKLVHLVGFITKKFVTMQVT